MATKKSTTKPATKPIKPQAGELVIEETALEPAVVKEEPKKEVKMVKVEKPAPKKYDPTELIVCRSVFPGKLLFRGEKTKMIYTFSEKGDLNYVEYQDLLAATLTKKKAILSPYIVIEDEELLAQPQFNHLNELYNKTFVLDNIEDLLNLPAIEFKKQFNELPIGAKKSVMLVASTMLKEGRFDSLNKVSIIDEACNSNLAVMFNRD